jgi:hypothetical protein
LERDGETLPDKQASGHNFRYKLVDALKRAFAVFFFQHPSMLDFQRQMQEKRKRGSLQGIFGLTEIPSDTQIKTLVDGIAPECLGGVFNEGLKIIVKSPDIGNTSSS